MLSLDQASSQALESRASLRADSERISVPDWKHREIAHRLHEWAERFNLQFKLQIPLPAIRIEPIRVSKIGTYREGRNGLGIAHEVTFNSRYLNRSLAEMLQTLLHELLHLWQFLYGRPGRGNYHNMAFRRKAALYGLQIDERGHHIGVLPGLFTQLLLEHRVEISTLHFADEPAFPKMRTKGDSKLKKWTCGCTNVRCAVELIAKCGKCGQQFQETSSAW